MDTVVDLARQAAEAAGEASAVGDHLDIVAETDAIGTLSSYRFACLQPGYQGWYWSVSVSSLDGATSVNDVVLLPGDTAIVAPVWTPYKERIRPGDLSPGDLLPPEEDDVRLVPAWQAGDSQEAVDRAFAREVGLGREWVLSSSGRDLAADRWFDGETGPATPIAEQAPGRCGSCGFLISLAGPLSTSFGVCANAMANSDGRVVSLRHGCGAHSKARLSRSAASQILPPPVHDTVSHEEIQDV